MKESNASLELSLLHLKDAILLLPEDEKKAYMKALDRAPLLIEKESLPVHFLRCENFDPFNAARRLTSNWDFRRKILGDRAFLPLVLTGTGALTETEIEALANGTSEVAMLPMDRKGRNVLFLDRIQSFKNVPIQKLRYLFFLLAVISQEENSWKDGVVVICRVLLGQGYNEGCVIDKGKSSSSGSMSPVISFFDLLRLAFPVPLQSVHIVFVDYRRLASRSSHDILDCPQNVTTHFHPVQTELEALSSLEPWFHKGALPDCFGGIWTYEMFTKWVKHRKEADVALEKSLVEENRKLGPGAPELSETDSLNVPGIAAQAVEVNDSASAVSLKDTKHPAGKRKRDQEDTFDIALNVETNNPRSLPSRSNLAQRSAPPLALLGTYMSPQYRMSKEVPYSENWLQEREGRVRLEEALKLISNRDKQAYVSAEQNVPHLVRIESDPCRFLRVESFDPSAAARRLVGYWENRKRVFKERAHRPLAATGDGALYPEDIHALDTGEFVILPNTSNSQSVLGWDQTRLSVLSNDTSQSKMRVLFFLLSIIGQDYVSQTDGFVLLLRVDPISQFGLCNALTHQLLDLVNNFLPICISNFVVYLCTSRGGQSAIPNDTVIAALRELEQAYALPKTTVLDQSLQQLESEGLCRDFVSEFLNGTLPLMPIVYPPETQAIEEPTLMSRVWGKHTNLLSEEVKGQKSDTTVQNKGLAPQCGPTSPTEKTELGGLQQLREALSIIPDADKASYLEALRLAPNLVEKESTPIMFLRYHKFDAWSAAKMLVTYWARRKFLFGERTFLPMTLTGRGALSQEHVAILSSGYLAFLPDDNRGRSVICYDASLLRDGGQQKLRTGCMFYMLTVALGKDKGVLFLSIFNKLSWRRTIGTWVTIDLWQKAFPLDTELHVILRPNESKKYFFGTMVPLIIVVKKYWDLTIHAQNTKEELVAQLRSIRLFDEGIPNTVGGTWSYQNFSEWLWQRTLLEREKFGHKADDDLNRILMDSRQGIQLRERSMMSSRNRREHQKHFLESLQHQFSELTEENNRLKKEISFREDLLHAAKREAELHAGRLQQPVASTTQGGSAVVTAGPRRFLLPPGETRVDAPAGQAAEQEQTNLYEADSDASTNVGAMPAQSYPGPVHAAAATNASCCQSELNSDSSSLQAWVQTVLDKYMGSKRS